jgi:uncharacterized damage-inducible protein DinB
MPTSDILQILLSHDAWATQQILDACSKLTTEQFHQRFDMGPGSLHDTTAHIMGAMQAWTQTLAGKGPQCAESHRSGWAKENAAAVDRGSGNCGGRASGRSSPQAIG